MKSITNTLVLIPSGHIELRDDRLKKKWRVDIARFQLSKYLVTQVQYVELMKTNPSTFKGNENPVETITWLDAIHFCNALSVKENLTPYYSIETSTNDIKQIVNSKGYRLPTEAEWEYASKAGSTETRYGELDTIAWYKGNSNAQTHAVGLKQPNQWGLFDTLGNVWEWCSDIYDEEIYGEYRVFRGGGWFDEDRGCLATNRRRSHPTSFKIDDLGFRIAKSV